jgi:hypothetical protein
MRVIISFCIAALCCVWLSAGEPAGKEKKADQPPGPPQTLEQMQAEALKKNGDVKVAEAKLRLAEAAVRLAEAELERERIRIKAMVAVANQDFLASQAAEFEAAERFKRAEQLYKRGVIPEEARLTYIKLTNERRSAQLRLNSIIAGASVGAPDQKQLDTKKAP